MRKPRLQGTIRQVFEALPLHRQRGGRTQSLQAAALPQFTRRPCSSSSDAANVRGMAALRGVVARLQRTPLPLVQRARCLSDITYGASNTDVEALIEENLVRWRSGVALWPPLWPPLPPAAAYSLPHSSNAHIIYPGCHHRRSGQDDIPEAGGRVALPPADNEAGGTRALPRNLAHH